MEESTIAPEKSVYAIFPKGHWLRLLGIGIPNPKSHGNFHIKKLHAIRRDGTLACACELDKPTNQFIYALDELKDKHRYLLCESSQLYIKGVVDREKLPMPK